jgi:hypothetical protein
MEETIPSDRRRGDVFAFEVTEMITDDPRWTAACHRYNQATKRCDELAAAMLDAPVANVASLVALMAYAGEHVEQGYLWPEDIVDETVDDRRRSWERWLLMKAAKVMRELGDEPSAAPARKADSDLDPGRAAHIEELASAFVRIEGELHDMVRAAQLAENQLHETLGNLDCAHDGESR